MSGRASKKSLIPPAESTSPTPVYDGLRIKYQIFIDEYLGNSFNATLAYGKAYPQACESTRRSMSSRLLRRPEIQAAINERRREVVRRVELSQDYVLKNLVEVSEKCLRPRPVYRYENGKMVHQTDRDGYKVYQFDSKGAVRANELLGKYLDMFTDKVQHDVRIQKVDIKLDAALKDKSFEDQMEILRLIADGKRRV